MAATTGYETVTRGSDAHKRRVPYYDPDDGSPVIDLVLVETVALTPLHVQGNVAGDAPDAGYPVKAGAIYRVTPPTYADLDRSELHTDANGNLKISEQRQPAYEDNTLGKAVVEHRYTYSRKTASGQVKGSAGFVHTVTIAPTTASPTAGLLTVYDNTAGSGTIVYSEWVFATTPGHTVVLDVECPTGIYVLYTTLDNVSCTVGYR